METSDLTLRVLQEIRDGQRETNSRLEKMSGETNARFEKMSGETSARFEVLETVLRDLAQQMVMLSRGIKTALESRSEYEGRISSLEQRVDLLEKPSH